MEYMLSLMTKEQNIILNFTIRLIKTTCQTLIWPDNHPCAGQPIVLRDYQVETINKFLEGTTKQCRKLPLVQVKQLLLRHCVN